MIGKRKAKWCLLPPPTEEKVTNRWFYNEKKVSSKNNMQDK